MLVVLLGVGVMTMVVALTACNTPVVQPTKPLFKGDHKTEQIRAMWLVCFQSRKATLPYLPDPSHWRHCDCFSDKSREKYNYSTYQKTDALELRNIFIDIHRLCEKENGEEHIKDTAI